METNENMFLDLLICGLIAWFQVLHAEFIPDYFITNFCSCMLQV